MRALEGEGLVRQGSRGFQVAEITIEEMSETFQIVARLEEELTRSAALKVTPEDLGQMEKIARRMDAAVRSRNISDYFDSNLQFHAVIQSRCPNRKLVELMGSFGKQTIRYRRLASARRNSLRRRAKTAAHGARPYNASAINAG